ncbi:MAG TPA: hypothetical protein ENJ35_05495 [Gammaproteobacteria bacterium]|nr:hypothetical protein [Gammaproteobacteria bacterium]
MDMQQKSLGLVVGGTPSSAEMRVALRIADAAIDNGVTVRLFLIGDGLGIALNTKSNKGPFKTFRSILSRGADVTLCSVMLRDRGCPSEFILPEVVLGSLIYFAEMVKTCDRIICLR